MTKEAVYKGSKCWKMTCSMCVTFNSHRYNNGREINAETWPIIYENIGAGGFFLTEDHRCYLLMNSKHYKRDAFQVPSHLLVAVTSCRVIYIYIYIYIYMHIYSIYIYIYILYIYIYILVFMTQSADKLLLE